MNYNVPDTALKPMKSSGLYRYMLFKERKPGRNYKRPTPMLRTINYDHIQFDGWYMLKSL